MVAYPGQDMKLPIAPLLGGTAALAALIATALVPMARIEDAVMASGLPAVIAAAAPPLGATARAALCFGAGLAAGLSIWMAAFLVFGTRAIRVPVGRLTRSAHAGLPLVRRADAHPDAPPRAPVMAMRDLGAPLPPPRIEADEQAFARVEAGSPFDLDVPLDSLLASGGDPVAPVATNPAGVLAKGERIETFELTPIVRAAPAPAASRPASAISAAETDATVQALLTRLERGIARRGAPAPRHVERPAMKQPLPGGLDQALGQLRRMAASA